MIGTALSERLLAEGHEVVGVDRVPPRWADAMRDRTILADLRNLDLCRRLIPSGLDACVHLAAWARVYDLVHQPLLAVENVVTTAHALEVCREKGIPRFVFASSREVYGTSEEIPVREEPVHAHKAENAYSASKGAGEAFVWAYANNYGLEAALVRFSNVYGRYDLSDRVIPRFLRLVRRGSPLQLFAPDKVMDLIFLDDAVDGVVRLLDRFSDARGGRFNLGAGEGTTLRAIAHEIQRAIGRTVEVAEEPNRPGEVLRFVADIQRARDVLGFAPKTSFAEGLARAAAWYSQYDSLTS